MAKSHIQVDASNLKEMLQRYSETKGKSIPLIVRSNARLFAVELANRTQPFSVGKGEAAAAKKKGVEKVGRDISKVIKTPKTVEERIRKFDTEKLRERMITLFKARKITVLGSIFFRVGMLVSPSSFSELGGDGGVESIHKSRRKNGSTRSVKGVIDMAPSSINPYIAKVSKRVGYTKNGWAECARKIGGVKGDATRGIPAFAKRQNADNGEIQDNSGNSESPHFILRNKTPWCSKLLSESQQDQAKRVTMHKMEKQIFEILKAVSKQKADVKSITAAIVAQD